MVNNEKQRSQFVCHTRPFVCRYALPNRPSVWRYKPFVALGNRATSGFTLVELVTTLVIAGILVAMAAPRFGGLVQGDRLTSQANKLVLDLNTARSEAIRRGENVTVCKQDPAQTGPSCDTTTTATWSGGWVTFVDTDGDSQVSTGEKVLHRREALDGAQNTLTGSAAVKNLLVYLPSGLTTIANKAAFLFCDQRGIGRALAVQVIATGRATVAKPSALSVTSCSSTSGWAY